MHQKLGIVELTLGYKSGTRCVLFFRLVRHKRLHSFLEGFHIIEHSPENLSKTIVYVVANENKVYCRG